MGRKKPMREQSGLRALEKVLKKLSLANLSRAERPTLADMDARGFGPWVRFARAQRNPDQVRNALYYGFQPLYDCIVEDRISEINRAGAVQVLGALIGIGTRFLTGYYTGEPDVRDFQKELQRLQHTIERLDSEHYQTKSRNMDQDYSSPAGINEFLKLFLTATLDGKFQVPSYVIGCACGSSEVAMPLAGALGTQIGFLRKSKRRYDEEVRVISEQVPAIRAQSKGNVVACIEDYVNTAASLRSVMQQAQQYGASAIIGAAAGLNDHGLVIPQTINRHKFHIFSLGGKTYAV